MKVGPKKIVSFRYTMRNDQGDLLEDIMDQPPVEYLHGSEDIFPGLEIFLEGLNLKEKKSITITPETVSGINSIFHFDIIIDNIRIATKEEIQAGKILSEISRDNCGPGCKC